MVVKVGGSVTIWLTFVLSLFLLLAAACLRGGAAGLGFFSGARRLGERLCLLLLGLLHYTPAHAEEQAEAHTAQKNRGDPGKGKRQWGRKEGGRGREERRKKGIVKRN